MNVWTATHGMDLEAVPAVPYTARKRIVGLLNFWQDAEELKESLPTWVPHVDLVLAVDGCYEGMPGADVPWSTDASHEVILRTCRFLGKAVTLVKPQRFYADQCEKRTAILRHAALHDGDWLLWSDADEYWTGLEDMRNLPWYDLGWVTYTSRIYARPQGIPRLFRWREGLGYAVRHHWLHVDGQLVTTNQQTRPGWLSRRFPEISFHNSRGTLRTGARQQNAQAHRVQQDRGERRLSPAITAQGHEPLRILQTGPLDPGCTIFRLHTAINSTTPHTSVMATELVEWLEEPQQYPLTSDLNETAQTADIHHCHVTELGAAKLGRQCDVMHHHGTTWRSDPDHWRRQDEGKLRICSNLEMVTHGDTDLHWLPNPVPVARYRRLADQHPVPQSPFRVAHSPTKPKFKNTDDFLAACERLQAKGLNIEPVLIHRKPLRESLRIKASCHAVYDSLWLGMQNSGLEGAAMGKPVLAGDAQVREQYEERIGYCPYIWVDAKSLEGELERLYFDRAYRLQTAQRVHDYVLAYHDYGAVTRRYLELLDQHFDWRNRMRLGYFTGTLATSAVPA